MGKETQLSHTWIILIINNLKKLEERQKGKFLKLNRLG